MRVFLFILLLSLSSAVSFAQSGHPEKKVTRVKKPQVHKEADTVGVVNGQVITFVDFKSLLAGRVRARIEETRDSVVTDSEYSTLVDSSWNASIRYILMQQEIAKRKIDVSEIEAKNYILANPPDFIRQQFMDSTGHFDSLRWVYSAKDRRNEDVMSPMVHAAQIQLETNQFLKAIVGDATTESEKEKRYEAWERKAIQRAKIVDRRLNFGFY